MSYFGLNVLDLYLVLARCSRGQRTEPTLSTVVDMMTDF
jgi:hypothetical protein